MANAASWNFTYVTGVGVLSGQLTGTLQGDNNTILISSVDAAAFNAVPGPSLPYVYSLTGFSLGNLGAAPFTSIDGSVQDFLACLQSNCDAEGFYFDTSQIFGRPDYTGGISFGQISSLYNQSNWSIVPATTGAVPEPSSWAMLIAGFGLVGAVARRRQTVARAA